MVKYRVNQLLEYKRIKKEVFYKKIGMSPTSFRGKAEKSSLSSDVLAKILSEIPDMNLYWLITGEGEIINENQNIEEILRITRRLKRYIEIGKHRYELAIIKHNNQDQHDDSWIAMYANFEKTEKYINNSILTSKGKTLVHAIIELDKKFSEFTQTEEFSNDKIEYNSLNNIQGNQNFIGNNLGNIVGNNMIQISLPEEGTQKIIKPDGTIIVESITSKEPGTQCSIEDTRNKELLDKINMQNKLIESLENTVKAQQHSIDLLSKQNR